MGIKRILKIIYNIFLTFIVVITSYSLFNYWGDSSSVFGEEITISKLQLEKEELKEEKSLDYFKNYYSNDEIIGSLKIRNTSIDVLLAKHTNNDYYLNHNLRREYDGLGSIYVDYRVNLNSKQINIYGHNSPIYDVEFKELSNYLDKDYYSDHKFIELWDGKEVYIYEIFSVQIVTTDYEHMNVAPGNWANHINKLSKSLYKTNVDVKAEDNILILQTSNYNPNNSYLIICSKKVT